MDPYSSGAYPTPAPLPSGKVTYPVATPAPTAAPTWRKLSYLCIIV